MLLAVFPRGYGFRTSSNDLVVDITAKLRNIFREVRLDDRNMIWVVCDVRAQGILCLQDLVASLMLVRSAVLFPNPCLAHFTESPIK